MKDSNLLKHVDPDKTPDYQIERIFCAEVQALSMFYDVNIFEDNYGLNLTMTLANLFQEQHNSAGLDSWLPWEIAAAIIVPAVFILLLLALGCKWYSSIHLNFLNRVPFIFFQLVGHQRKTGAGSTRPNLIICLHYFYCYSQRVKIKFLAKVTGECKQIRRLTDAHK